MKKYAWLLAASLLLAACTDESQPLEEETPVTSDQVEDTETTDDAEDTEAAAEDKGKEDSASDETTEELSWDEQILSDEGKALLLAGKIPGTNLSIGSTLAEVEAELGSPDAEGYDSGAPLKSYGNIHIAHLMDGEEIVHFFLTLDEPVTMDTVHEAWGEPTEVAPMEFNDIIERHSYEGNGYHAFFELTNHSPDKTFYLTVTKNQ